MSEFWPCPRCHSLTPTSGSRCYNCRLPRSGDAALRHAARDEAREPIDGLLPGALPVFSGAPPDVPGRGEMVAGPPALLVLEQTPARDWNRKAGAPGQLLTAVLSAVIAPLGTALVTVAAVLPAGEGWERAGQFLLVSVIGILAVGGTCGILGGLFATRTGALLGGLLGLGVVLLVLGAGGFVWVALGLFTLGWAVGSVIGTVIG